ncbi:MFS transporter [Deinococcus maricopensis]|uniref:Major facilitator superfamily MFS_1 n=1 Tax=Deinococcus maricopensis (strain DSM 21211 / LMG 22137 / NRRL B-23946 / LB-34) TaxID=709986 RepID=E8U737_DEIML|nr:MFS transporter [Deinococcus maricopensis]ADV66876.1 major facilitator superfamily MFS_1 [Deinococcus maricopensis DSM 21211]
MTVRADPYAALRFPEFRALLASGVASSFASRALAVVIGYQIYQLTKSPLALGWLGLVEAAPALGLALIGGHVADRRDRRRILLITRVIMLVTALMMAFVGGTSLAALYTLVFITGLARGFGDPASSAFETQVVPMGAFVNAGSWLGSAGQAAAMVGPAVGGFAFDLMGARGAYLMIAVLHAVSLVTLALIAPKPLPVMPGDPEPIGQSIRTGVQFVARDRVLVGSMALDLFAVLFGGAVALLPVFAHDILKVGATGLGFLVAAPSVGALLAMLWATRHPPLARAGLSLLLNIAGFGVSIIVFALSRSLWLSLVALALSGAFDGVSMVIRRAIVRLRTPDHLRGRVAAVSLLFIGSSNEIGAFESGVAANLLGTARSVWAGGIVTLLVVAATAGLVPELRHLSLIEPQDD